MHLLLLVHVITAWITVGAIQAGTRGVVAYGEVALMRGGEMQKEVRIQKNRDGRDSLLSKPDHSVDQLRRTNMRVET